MERWGCNDGGSVLPTWGDAFGIETGTTSYPVSYATYLAHPLVSWASAADNAHKFQRVNEQKWAAMFGQGVQAYSEIRRTGFPERIFEYELGGAYYPHTKPRIFLSDFSMHCRRRHTTPISLQLQNQLRKLKHRTKVCSVQTEFKARYGGTQGKTRFQLKRMFVRLNKIYHYQKRASRGSFLFLIYFI